MLIKGEIAIRTQAKRRSSRDRRSDILLATRKLLAEKGLEATTIAEIVSRAGVAQGTFYVYFSSRFAAVYALAEEMLESVLVRLRDDIIRAKSFEEAVEIGITAAFEQMGQYADVYAILNNGGGLVEHPADWEQLFEPFYHLISLWIAHWQALGQIEPTIHPEIAARLTVSLVERAVEDCYLYRPEIPSESYIAETCRFVYRALALKDVQA